jgi:hypothetical protein
MKKVVIFSGVILLAAALLVGSLFLGQANAQDLQPGSPWGGYNGNSQGGYGMMGGYNGNSQGGCGMMGDYNGYGQGGYAMMGMMHGFGGLIDADPLTIEQAETAVTNYLNSYGDDSLELGEIMIFDNHAYAQVLDTTTGNGAFEVLVDPISGEVFPEPGPNMMWNTEYGMMSGQFGGIMGGHGMMGGHYGSMMGGFGFNPGAQKNITEEDAVQLAQEYLDVYLPDTSADDHAVSFPGYFTLHIERDGDVIGMLSVNQYTGQVFLHHWHGDFIEMADENH